MYLQRPIFFFSLITMSSMALSTANAVLPAVATDNTALDSAVAKPLIPQIVPSAQVSQPQAFPIQPIQLQPVTTVVAPIAVIPSVSMPQAPISQVTISQSPSQTQLQTKLTASVVAVNPQGGEMLAPITAQTHLTKGNIIEYHGYVINNTPERVKSLKATFDIPAGTELQSVTGVSPQPVYGSNNGVQFNYMPIKSSVNGILQEVPMSYYKAVQWDIAGLGLNEVAEVKYRVMVK